MTANNELYRQCRLCHQNMPTKYARNLYSTALDKFHHYLREFFGKFHEDDGESRYICQLCWTKLGRITRLDKELATRLNVLKERRKQLWNELVSTSRWASFKLRTGDTGVQNQNVTVEAPAKIQLASLKPNPQTVMEIQPMVTLKPNPGTANPNPDKVVQKQNSAGNPVRKIQPLLPLKPKPTQVQNSAGNPLMNIQPLVPLQPKPAQVLLVCMQPEPLQLQVETILQKKKPIKPKECRKQAFSMLLAEPPLPRPQWTRLSENSGVTREFNIEQSSGPVPQSSLKNFSLDGSEQPPIVVTPSVTCEPKQEGLLDVKGEGEVSAIKKENITESEFADGNTEGQHVGIEIGKIYETTLEKNKIEQNCDDIKPELLEKDTCAILYDSQKKEIFNRAIFDNTEENTDGRVKCENEVENMTEWTYSETNPMAFQPGLGTCIIKTENISDTECSGVGIGDGIREENISDTVYNLKVTERSNSSISRGDRKDKDSREGATSYEDRENVSYGEEVRSQVGDDDGFSGVGCEESSCHAIGESTQYKTEGGGLEGQLGSAWMEMQVLQQQSEGKNGGQRFGPSSTNTGFGETSDWELGGEDQMDTQVTAKKLNVKRNPQESGRIQVSAKSYGCRICGRFIQTRKLADHEKQHSQKKKHVCRICGKGFSQLATLKYHAFVHREDTPFSCRLCEKSFRSAVYLRNHFRIHTGEKPHVCSTCGKSFTCSSYLITHERIHTGEKPYTCVTCGKGFAQSGDLKRHVVVHTGDWPYTCDVCGKNYVMKRAFKRHYKQHTNEYVCKICGKNFRYRAYYEKHINSKVHERSYTCSSCGESFALARHLKKHAKIHSDSV